MKLKFRAEPKDILIFISFCLVLFYLSAITVLNISEMSSYGEVHGFNPLPAFTSEFILPVLVFFTVALIIIISSVSSYFFEMDKGVGVTLNKKKEKGYSRWLGEKEMKKIGKKVFPSDVKAVAAGIPLINNGREIWVDDSEYHSLIIGSTGSGKTELMVKPLVKLLAKNNESMIITDPKGEIYKESVEMLKEKGYNVVLLNFREPQRGASWNPLMLPYNLYKEGNQDKATELLDDLALNILYDESSKGQDPFWEKTSADYFAGLALALFEDADEKEINLNSINLMTTVGEEKTMGGTYIKEYFSHKDKNSPSYINAASTLMAPTDTKGSILSVFKQKIKLFSARENIAEMLSHSSFEMSDIGKKKTAVFLVVHDEKKTYHSLVTIFIKQCYETLIDVAQVNGGKLPFRTNFILDEFANMPPLKDVTTMVTAARSRLVRFNFIIQNFAQLSQVYGKENADTIKGNCGNIIYLISSEIAALEEISKMCGEVKSKKEDKTSSTPLVTVSDLQRMSQNETIYLRTREMPFKTKLTPNYQMDWGVKYSAGDYPERVKKEVKVFDIKAYVESKRKDSGASPFSAFNPRNPMGMPSGPKPRNNEVPSEGGDVDIDEMIRRIDQKIADLEAEEAAEKKAEKEGSKPNEIMDKVSAMLGDNSNNRDTKTKEEIPVPKKIEAEKPKKEIEEERMTPFDFNSLYKEEKHDDTPVEPKVEKPVEIKTDKPVEPKTEIETEKFGVTIRREAPKPTIKEDVNTEKVEVTDDQFFDDFFGDDEDV